MLYGVSDVATRLRVSKRWVQKLAAEFGFGTRVGRTLVFTEEDAARLSGQKPKRVSVQVPIHPAIAEVLQEMADLEGKSLGGFAADSLISHLRRSVSGG